MLSADVFSPAILIEIGFFHRHFCGFVRRLALDTPDQRQPLSRFFIESRETATPAGCSTLTRPSLRVKLPEFCGHTRLDARVHKTCSCARSFR